MDGALMDCHTREDYRKTIREYLRETRANRMGQIVRSQISNASDSNWKQIEKIRTDGDDSTN